MQLQTAHHLWSPIFDIFNTQQAALKSLSLLAQKEVFRLLLAEI
jgi:hypothetical protein